MGAAVAWIAASIQYTIAMATHVFLDESGDLSFQMGKPGVSEHFIITALVTEQPRRIERQVAKVIRLVKHRYPKHRGWLHAYNEDPPTRRRLLTLLRDADCRVLVIHLDKRKVYTRLSDEKPVLYNYVANILLDRLIGGALLGRDALVQLTAARRETNKFLNANFADYLKRQIRSAHGVRLKVAIRSPQEERCLQAVDMVSWAVFRQLELGDDSYCAIMQERLMVSNLFS
jgi:hypothetical protein